MITLNCALWSSHGLEDEKYKSMFNISPEVRKAILDQLKKGKGILASHAAPICFDDWPPWKGILRCYWKWDQTGHSPFDTHAINVKPNSHGMLYGINNFEIKDEIYPDFEFTKKVSPLLEAKWNSEAWPLMWINEHKSGYKQYIGLGHAPETFGQEDLNKILQRSVLWVSRCNIND